MSLLWRDRLQVFFAPGEVSVVRFPKGLRYEGLKFRGLKFKGLKFGSLKFGSLKFGSLKFGSLKPKPEATVSAVCEQKIGGAPWESPLEELERCLEGAGGTDVVITISNHFVRYSVLAPQKDIANPSELNSYAEFHMREVFGERAAGWVLSIGAWDPCNGGVCAAIDRELYDRLEELAVRSKARLQYIEPYLTSAFDHCRKRLEDSRSWFALVEAGRLCLALLEHGAWQYIRNQRIGQDIKGELLATLDQEAILSAYSGRAAGTVYLLAPGYPQLTLPEDCSWRIVWLAPDFMTVPQHFPRLPAAGETTTCAASG